MFFKKKIKQDIHLKEIIFSLNLFNDKLDKLNSKIIELNNKIDKNTEKLNDKIDNKIDSSINKLTDKLNNNLINYAHENENKNIEEYIINEACKRINEKNKTEINENITIINDKLDILFFDNEIIKHQLLLEDEIRKYGDEINNLSLIINKTIKTIET